MTYPTIAHNTHPQNLAFTAITINYRVVGIVNGNLYINPPLANVLHHFVRFEYMFIYIYLFLKNVYLYFVNQILNILYFLNI